jgi:tetratricopeptide (TPR) repeat protein
VVTAAYLKPNPRDKNVMPYEVKNFVEEKTDFKVVLRVGGDLGLVRSFIAAGFPVILEKGLDSSKSGWLGHYQVLAGYDEERQIFHAYDSYEGDFSDGQTLQVSYEKVDKYWRHFNYVYLVIYPAEREAEVLSLLGPHQDENYNFLQAAERASAEIIALSGRDLFFAWYNRGTNLMQLKDYGGAAKAYDEAFRLYASLDPEERPWRVLWYQTGPYFAYYYTGRYYDVINLATQTLDTSDEPALEESYYWRALSKEAIGDIEGAIEDFQTSLEYHPNFEPSTYHLDRLGASY